jgi:hypothetical protein
VENQERVGRIRSKFMAWISEFLVSLAFKSSKLSSKQFVFKVFFSNISIPFLRRGVIKASIYPFHA